MTPAIASIHVYPLKSCAPSTVEEAFVEHRGLRHDRRWLAVDAKGKFLTAREFPRLTLIRATLHAQGLQLDAPGMPSTLVRFPEADSVRSAVTIWDDTVAALSAHDDATAWISEFLRADCRLVYMDDACARSTDADYAKPGDEVSFADGYPLLLLSTSAIGHLNTRLANPVSPLRFRPNILVAGTEPHAEDGWKRIRIGEAEFDLVKLCIRCVLTTVDFRTGERDPSGEPLRTLVQYRRTPKGVAFGQNLTPRRLGRIRVGDAVEILA